jgi:hypothetical protein
MSADSIEHLVASSQEFLIPLRMGEGFNAEKFEAFCNAVRKFTLEWKERDVIPKIIAGLFIDTYSVVISSSYLYPADLSHIQERGDFLNDLIRECCQK